MSDHQRAPLVLARPDHSISRKNIDPLTVKVLYRLNSKGYKAYMVGGAVRDLLLGRQPKDFDVATDARPHDVKRLFRNCRIIGRRFRLAHVYFPGNVIEVATFRRTPDPEKQDSGPEEMLITSDNTWGSPREDAFRRDFTINALFYDIGDYSVIDYCGGIDDLEDGVIRVIGDPDVRFREDPVRMLRACEFAARLNFRIEEDTAEAIVYHRLDLQKASPARVTEELIQLLRCGHAARAFQFMVDLEILDVLLPEAMAMVEAERLGIGTCLRVPSVLDEMTVEGREISDALALAAPLVPAVLVERFAREEGLGGPMSRRELHQLVVVLLTPFFGRFRIAGQRAATIEEAMVRFLSLCEPGWSPEAQKKFARQRGFDDGLTLFEIMVRATNQGEQELEAWKAVRTLRGPVATRPAGDRGGKRRRRPRRRRRS